MTLPGVARSAQRPQTSLSLFELQDAMGSPMDGASGTRSLCPPDSAPTGTYTSVGCVVDCDN
ncbi:hypothetical protein JMJ77_0012260 [Colletotrichum scovillei]|uniref:Uncharacterized protein n=1 Tax=Colletotrichum scovillei TaxID=1209932 RepID=A0A9P7UBR9_9PEZI|nr:hypothetical protein JMJ78_0001312 [Colletotrichum scovillei]KAG7041742.1 hypothetical protein JMJ77_0012260 [Colletotrichum scovillei]KAG7061771.1 hypothetical protein JMJ76_0003728 [Colletotrichum scovillei]